MRLSADQKIRKTLFFIFFFSIFVSLFFLSSSFFCRKIPPFQWERKALPEKDLTELATWVKKEEAKHSFIREGLAKTILWTTPNNPIKTPISLVYVHGFSSSWKELSPSIENLAEALQANVFFTRLRGHAQTPNDLKSVTLQDWFQDINEAVTIGEKIGEKIWFIANSTGASLIVTALPQLEAALGEKIAGAILLSPNFGVKDSRGNILLIPGGRKLMQLFVGEYRETAETNKLRAHIWTTKQPIESLVAMMEASIAAKKTKIEEIRSPVLCLYTPSDETVNVQAIEKHCSRFSSPDKKILPFSQAKYHILAGDAVSPSTTADLEGVLLQYIEKKR